MKGNKGSKGTKWTDKQRAKFKATMKAKAAAKAGEQSIPLDAIPEREPRAPRKANGAVQLHAEVDKRTGELSLVIGTLRVPLRLRG